MPRSQPGNRGARLDFREIVTVACFRGNICQRLLVDVHDDPITIGGAGLIALRREVSFHGACQRIGVARPDRVAGHHYC
jgi:hypothetical protein